MTSTVSLEQTTVLTEDELIEALVKLKAAGLINAEAKVSDRKLVRVVLVLETPEAPQPQQRKSAFGWF